MMQETLGVSQITKGTPNMFRVAPGDNRKPE